MDTYTFHKLLHWKRGFPQVQFLLLFTFKSDAVALIWPKSLSRGWPLYALQNQLYGNTESPVSHLGQISKNPVHIGLKIIFIVGQSKYLLVDNFSLAERES